MNSLGISNAAAERIWTDEGMQNVEEFGLLDDHAVEGLCKAVRSPGGLINNPAAVAAAGASQSEIDRAARQPPQIRDPGDKISSRSEENLKLMTFAVRYAERTSNTITWADLTLPRVRALRQRRIEEKGHTDADAPELNFKDWTKTIEAIEDYLKNCLGVTKIPLAYVIRDDQAPTPRPTGGFQSRADELIARAPIVDNTGAYTDTFLQDRKKVWELLSKLTKNHECMSSFKSEQEDEGDEQDRQCRQYSDRDR